MDEIIKERMLRNLKQNAAEYFNHNPYTALKDIFLTNPDGCVPESYLGDDLNRDIHDKFYAVIDVIREETSNQDIEIYIEASYEDSTKCLMILGNKVLLNYSIKAWNFWWTTEDDMIQDIYSMYQGVAAQIINSKVWPCWNLSEEDIRMIAEEKDLSLEGKELEEIAQKAKKGIENALGDWPWDIIIEKAIKDTKSVGSRII